MLVATSFPEDIADVVRAFERLGLEIAAHAALSDAPHNQS